MKILSDKVKTVLVTAFQQMSGAAQNYIYIYKNDNGQGATVLVGSQTSVTISGIVVPVQQGDIIYHKAYSSSAGSISQSREWNFMTVSVLELA